MERYLRNHDAISEADQAALGISRVLVVGCGGLGGMVIECLARIAWDICGLWMGMFLRQATSTVRYCAPP